MSNEKPLDPEPYRGWDHSRRKRWSRFAGVWDPRPEYEQSKEAYSDEVHGW